MGLAFLVLAALGRPETWPFTGLYFLWAWRSVPAMRKFLAVGLALIPVMWFGVPTITNARPFVSAELAELSVRRIEGNKFLGVFHRYTALTYLPIQLLALLSVVIAYFRRNRAVLVLAGAAVLWMLVEMAFVLHGWPGVPRYMIESAGFRRARRSRGRLDPRRPAEAPSRCAVAVDLSLGRNPDRLADRRRARARRDRAGARRRRDLVHEHARALQITRLTARSTISAGTRTFVSAGARRPTSASSASSPTSRTSMSARSVTSRSSSSSRPIRWSSSATDRTAGRSCRRTSHRPRRRPARPSAPRCCSTPAIPTGGSFGSTAARELGRRRRADAG